jgi:hypothetical protein
LTFEPLSILISNSYEAKMKRDRQRKTAYAANVSGGVLDISRGQRVNVFQDNSASVQDTSSPESHFAEMLTNFSAYEAAQWQHIP